jgi:hypothetical protein
MLPSVPHNSRRSEIPPLTLTDRLETSSEGWGIACETEHLLRSAESGKGEFAECRELTTAVLRELAGG